jgi:DNA modification methylase
MGRFPAKLLVSDDVLDDGKKRKAVPKGGFGAMDIGIGKPGEKQKYRKKKMTMPDLRDVGKKSKEAIGVDKLSFGQVQNAERKDYEMWDIQEEDIGYSRFFSLDTWFNKNIKQLPEPVQQTFPFMIVPKASKSEKNNGLEFMEEKKSGAYVGRGGSQEDPNGMFKDRETKSRNIHPTVKPLTLMNYLVVLGSRKGDVVLEPFAGSGTTALACVSQERDYIAIEREEEYYEIAKARLKKVEEPLKLWEKFS